MIQRGRGGQRQWSLDWIGREIRRGKGKRAGEQHVEAHRRKETQARGKQARAQGTQVVNCSRQLAEVDRGTHMRMHVQAALLLLQCKCCMCKNVCR